MKRAPKVGQKVKYGGGSVVGPCVGVVERIYVKHTFNEDMSDEWNARNGKPLPEAEWHVCVKPDVLPSLWAYKGNNKFAPSVAEVEPV